MKCRFCGGVWNCDCHAQCFEQRGHQVMELESKVRAADRLADEVAVLVRRGIVGSRWPMADALLDYRDPPSTERADRIAKLEREVERLQHGWKTATEQATTCARCLVFKHTPWRDDEDGYICAGCMGKENENLKTEVQQLREALETISNGDHQGCPKASIPDEGECSECIIERALGRIEG